MADERDDRPGAEGFTADILREATASGTPDEPPPPDQPQGVAFPRRNDDADAESGADDDRRGAHDPPQ
jgi:hypothetical protein